MYFAKIETRDGLSIFYNGESFEVPNTHQDYADIRNVAYSNDPDAGARIKDILDRALNMVKTAISKTPDSGITIENGIVYYNGKELHNSLTDRMLRQLEEGFDITPLSNFLAKLQQNPSYRVVNSLYDFLEYGKIPITQDGDFVAYKAVASDWKDIYSGTIDNSIGSTPEVPRNEVDEDPEQTCSKGLHVCSFEYLPHFAHVGGHVVVCKVNPKDVVAIPKDYNNTKMRVCRYEVVAEVTDYYKKHEDVLSQRPVFNIFQDKTYLEHGSDDDDLDDFLSYES